MQLAHKMQAPRFVKQSVAKINTLAKDIVLPSKSTIGNKKIDLTVPKFKIDSSSIRSAYYIADAQLYHGKKGFVVVHNEEKQVIEKAFMDKTARDMTKKSIKHFLESGFFTLNQTNDGKFTLKSHHRLPGGGVGGATAGFYIGKFVTYFVCHGAIVIVSALSGPAAPATFAGLEACLAPHIELASQATSLAGGMIGAVVTGPV